MNRAVLAGAVVLLVAGCGSSSKPATPAAAGPVTSAAHSGSGSGSGTSVGGYNACAIFTKSMAAAILDAPVDAGKDQTFSGTPYPACLYPASNMAHDGATVTLTIFPDSSSSSTLLASYQNNYQGLKPLAGVGDKALQVAGGFLVVAVKGGVGCAMLRGGDAPADPAASTKALAGVCTAVFDH